MEWKAVFRGAGEHMARRDKQPFQFSGFEMTALSVSFTVTAGIVFLLGFYVGRNSAAHHAGLPDTVGRIPVERADVYAPGPATPADGDRRAAVEQPVRSERPSGKAPVPVAKPEKPRETPKAPEKPEEPKDLDFKPAYSVQVLATRRSADAERMVAGLKTKGYDAFVRKVEDAEGAWYRVRIGRFRDLTDARAMADRCRKEPGLGQAYVSTY